MATGVFLIRDNGELVEMTEEPYDSEDRLQEFLAKYPNLLAGDQVGSEQPRRWLLITREMSLPDGDSFGGRWSVDHLFLDQDGIPTLIEVKRSSDTRIRREVIGQLLEYAANAVVYWPVEKIRNQFEVTCKQDKSESQLVLTEFLGPERDTDSFWQQVKTNLQAGRLRLIIVADEIPRELRRIVEFLNEQMDPADFLAIEIKQYVGAKLRTLVPRVIGIAEKKRPPVREQRLWDKVSFFDELRKNHGDKICQVARDVLDWSEEHNLSLWWGKGKQTGYVIPVFKHEGEEFRFLSLTTGGHVQIPFGQISSRPPFDEEGNRMELLAQLNTISGVQLMSDAIHKYPTFGMDLLATEEALDRFLSTIDWAIETAKAGTRNKV